VDASVGYDTLVEMFQIGLSLGVRAVAVAAEAVESIDARLRMVPFGVEAGGERLEDAKEMDDALERDEP
jgi:hypothetical protein